MRIPLRSALGLIRVRRALGVAGALALAAIAPAAAQSPYECGGISPVAGDALRVTTILENLPNRPLFVTAPPGDRDRLFIVGQDGVIFLWKRGWARDQFEVFLDIQTRVLDLGNEQGLLGLAFDPDYATTGEFYVNYTEGNFLSSATVVARYRVSPTDPDVASTTEERILRFTQPQSNHNGGQVFFGPDGYLYIATGDGGGAGDQFGTCGNGQNRNTLLGKLLRIDVRGISGQPLGADCGLLGNYAIPADNPLRGQASACDEIFAWGLRNPWRSAFDAQTGDLFVADVGQDCWEEVNWVAAAEVRGSNFGWRQMEGSQCYNRSSGSCNPSGVTCAGSPACNDPSLTLPIVDVSHASGACSITGGNIYRGCRMPEVRGTYLYGDFCGGFVRSLRVAGGAATDQRDRTEELFGPGGFISSNTSFGEDAEGELYIVARGGDILKFVPPTESLEVSGAGAGAPFALGEGAWTWEDLSRSSMIPFVEYRVYRGRPNEIFTCIHRSALPSWTGDPDVPAAGDYFAYLVTGVDENGAETSQGEPQSSRALSPAPCP